MKKKLNNLSKLFDIITRFEHKETIDEYKYIEKYKKRIDLVVNESWINEIKDDSYDVSQREDNKEYSFNFKNDFKKSFFSKSDSYIPNLIITKNELTHYLYEEQKNEKIDSVTKKIYILYIELIERLYYEDMLAYSKINAYHIFDNLKILRELFKRMSILFLEKTVKIQETLSMKKDNWNHPVLRMLDEYEDIIENYTYELFNNLENTLENIYNYYYKNALPNKDKEKEFYVYFLIEINYKWIPLLEKIDKKLYSY